MAKIEFIIVQINPPKCLFHTVLKSGIDNIFALQISKKISTTTQLILDMAKMTVIYKIPKDKGFFEKHYFDIHVPLAKQLPGLIKYEINDGPIVSTTEHTEAYRIANLYFDTLETMMTAFHSEIGQKCAADRKILADNEAVQIYLYDTKNT